MTCNPTTRAAVATRTGSRSGGASSAPSSIFTSAASGAVRGSRGIDFERAGFTTQGEVPHPQLVGAQVRVAQGGGEAVLLPARAVINHQRALGRRLHKAFGRLPECPPPVAGGSRVACVANIVSNRSSRSS